MHQQSSSRTNIDPAYPMDQVQTEITTTTEAEDVYELVWLITFVYWLVITQRWFRYVITIMAIYVLLAATYYVCGYQLVMYLTYCSICMHLYCFCKETITAEFRATCLCKYKNVNVYAFI